MRSLKGVIIGMAVFAMIISLSGSLFADMGHGACRGCGMDKDACVAQIKTLKDSATALHTANPTLAKGLDDLADKKSEMMQKMQEWKNKHDAKMNLLKDSSVALKTSNPALSQELQKMSEKKYMGKEAHEAAEGVDE